MKVDVVTVEDFTDSLKVALTTVFTLTFVAPSVGIVETTEGGVFCWAAPVPESGIPAVGSDGSFDGMFRVALMAAEVDGLKTTPTVQFAEEAIDWFEHWSFVSANSEASAPPNARAPIDSVALPELESVTVFAAEVLPTVTLPNERLEGVAESFGAATVAPVPVRETVAVGVAVSFEAIEREPLCAPVDAGVKVTATVQFAPAATVGAALPHGDGPPLTSRE